MHVHCPPPARLRYARFTERRTGAILVRLRLVPLRAGVLTGFPSSKVVHSSVSRSLQAIHCWVFSRRALLDVYSYRLTNSLMAGVPRWFAGLHGRMALEMLVQSASSVRQAAYGEGSAQFIVLNGRWPET